MLSSLLSTPKAFSLVVQPPGSLILHRRAPLATSLALASEYRMIDLKCARLRAVACLKHSKGGEEASPGERLPLAGRIAGMCVALAVVIKLFPLAVSLLVAAQKHLPGAKAFYEEDKWLFEVAQLIISLITFLYNWIQEKEKEKNKKENEKEKEKEKKDEMD